MRCLQLRSTIPAAAVLDGLAFRVNYGLVTDKSRTFSFSGRILIGALDKARSFVCNLSLDMREESDQTRELTSLAVINFT